MCVVLLQVLLETNYSNYPFVFSRFRSNWLLGLNGSLNYWTCL